MITCNHGFDIVSCNTECGRCSLMVGVRVAGLTPRWGAAIEQPLSKVFKPWIASVNIQLHKFQEKINKITHKSPWISASSKRQKCNAKSCLLLFLCVIASSRWTRRETGELWAPGIDLGSGHYIQPLCLRFTADVKCRTQICLFPGRAALADSAGSVSRTFLFLVPSSRRPCGRLFSSRFAWR